MTNFKDTSKWEKKTGKWEEKTGSTILCRHEYDGKQREGELEKEPHSLHVQVDRLSVIDTTAWTVADKIEPDIKARFQSRHTGLHQPMEFEARAMLA